jgi:integrase
MARLSAVQVRNAKSREKAFKLYDEDGLFLLVTPTGRPKWRLKYRLSGKEKALALGTYPPVSLADARRSRDDARAKLREGVDPSAERQARKHKASSPDTFEAVALDYVATRKDWGEKTAAVRLARLKANIFPWIGRRPVSELRPLDIRPLLQRIEDRGHNELAHRMLQLCSQVFRHAIRLDWAERDPAGDLRGTLVKVHERHRSAIVEPRAVGALLRAIDSFEGSFVVKCALRISPLVFVRPGELRQAVWEEFDLEAAQWRIPAQRMKMRQPPVVPLANQAVAILRELHPLTGPSGYLFPSIRTRARPMSDNTLNAALRRLGYGKDEATAHGFRSTASTLLNEQGWSRDAIERQLAHAEQDKVRAAYSYADYLPERLRMMQEWADYLDQLKAGTSNQIQRFALKIQFLVSGGDSCIPD